MSNNDARLATNDRPQNRAPYEAPRLTVHGTVTAMTQAQPSNPRATGLVEAEITFLGSNA